MGGVARQLITLLASFQNGPVPALVHPTSAAADRVFSLIVNSFNADKTVLWKTISKPQSCCNN